MSKVKIARLTWSNGFISKTPAIIEHQPTLAKIMLKNSSKSKEPEYIKADDIPNFARFFANHVGKPEKISREEGEKAVIEDAEKKDQEVIDELPELGADETQDVEVKIEESDDYKRLIRLTKPELRTKAGKLELDTDGSKEDLVKRILNAK